MKINFHYEHSGIDTQASHLLAANKLFYIFKEKYPKIEFEIINLLHLNIIPEAGQFCKFKNNALSAVCIIIENPENKKYFLISFMDKLDNVAGWDLENCVEIFAAGGVHTGDLRYSPCPFPYTPISPPHYTHTWEIIAEEYYRQNLPKITPEKPFFMSLVPYLFREYIHNDPRFDSYAAKVPYKEFIEIIGSHSIVIDINSVAEISNRTIDAFSLGCALLRPKFTVKFHNELIPDFHYAAVRCDDLSNYKELADAYIERFEELKKDKDMARFLSVNGRKWYEENSTLESHVNILSKVINIEKLF
jgi:hypothetical protein